MTLKSIAGERLVLVDDAEDHDQQAAQQGDEGPVEALGGDQGVGDDEDAAREQDVHVRTPDGRARARLDHSVCRSLEDVGVRFGRAYPPGPSLAATTSDVCPRATFIFSRASMTVTGYRSRPLALTPRRGSRPGTTSHPSARPR